MFTIISLNYGVFHEIPYFFLLFGVLGTFWPPCREAWIWARNSLSKFMLFTCFGYRKKEFLWNRSENGDFHVFSVDFQFSRAKTRKLRSRASGWASGNVEKVLRLISNPSWGVRPWLDFSRITHFCGNWRNSTKFHETFVILHHFQLRGVEMVPGRPRGRNTNETYAFPMPF